MPAKRLFVVYTREEGGEFYVRESTRLEYEWAKATGKWVEHNALNPEYRVHDLAFIALMEEYDHHDFVLGSQR